jgi:hypothetical protein
LKVSNFFSGCPVLNIPGTIFPVEKFYSTDRPTNYVESSLRTAIGTDNFFLVLTITVLNFDNRHANVYYYIKTSRHSVIIQQCDYLYYSSTTTCKSQLNSSASTNVCVACFFNSFITLIIKQKGSHITWAG